MRLRGALAMLVGTAGLLLSRPMPGQGCTTQAMMAPAVRDGLAAAAMSLGTAVVAGDAAAMKAATIAEYANNFAAIEGVIRSTSDKVKGDSLQVTQVYLLDASKRQAGDTSEADFSCALKNSTSETDFGIPGLPTGVYGFAMVEAMRGAPGPATTPQGGTPLESAWLLAFLLQQEGGGWKMAGFYPHTRTAAGHDGVWYWAGARERVKAKQPWLAWLYFTEADELLRPANFVSSTQLDKLRAEQHAALPPPLSDGISVATPLVVKTADGAEFHFTAMTSEAAADDLSLHLVLHYAADAAVSPDADRAKNLAAAKAMMREHPELRSAFSAVIVFGDVTGQNPTVLSVPMGELP